MLYCSILCYLQYAILLYTICVHMCMYRDGWLSVLEVSKKSDFNPSQTQVYISLHLLYTHIMYYYQCMS